eukprot:m.15354 g.15354  ORF g.15354 m.15354 type:complete len:59 (-) comp6575_c0_seq2:1122-1298(-)
MASAASKTQLAFQQHVKSAYLCHDDLSLDDELWLVAVPSTVRVDLQLCLCARKVSAGW